MSAKHTLALVMMLASACSAQTPPEIATTGTSDVAPAQSVVANTRTEIPVCSRGQLLGYVPDAQEIDGHRQTARPTIRYPFNTQLEGHWGFELKLRVDETGRVACYSAVDRFGRKQPLTPQRRAELANLRSWRFTPFTRNGSAAAAIVSDRLDEEEQPEAHLPLPIVPLDRVHISLERTGCYGSCPAYRVDIHGDGRVTYNGGRFVDVEGEHTYEISPSDVARLVESLRTKDLWSLRPAYRAGITDNPTYLLTMRMGDKEHQIEDYVGRWVGMPRAVTDFEDEVDRIAKSNMWLNLSSEAVELLELEGFQFDSRAGGEMLARAIANTDTKDEQAMLRLIEMGAPLSAPEQLLEKALANHHASVVDALIARGALTTKGKPDQAKIDAAFHAAIAGGQLPLVEMLWKVHGGPSHPSLLFEDVDEESGKKKQVPVTLLLSHRQWNKNRWDGMEIAQWLAERGCDIKASGTDGDTLLHIAAEAGDTRFVRYLLEQGLDASARGEYGLPPMGSVTNEDVALLLLEAGGAPAKMSDFRRYAGDNHWERVTRWLRVHGR